jgi:hypothetical protein
LPCSRLSLVSVNDNPSINRHIFVKRELVNLICGSHSGEYEENSLPVNFLSVTSVLLMELVIYSETSVFFGLQGVTSQTIVLSRSGAFMLVLRKKRNSVWFEDET